MQRRTWAKLQETVRDQEAQCAAVHGSQRAGRDSSKVCLMTKDMSIVVNVPLVLKENACFGLVWCVQ